MGVSKEHATNIGLILYLQTKRLSPQFRFLYDDSFTTVKSVEDLSDPVLDRINWDELITFLGVEWVLTIWILMLDINFPKSTQIG